LEPPDALEKRLRFGCGFVFGFLISGLSGFIWYVTAGHYVLAFSLFCGLICGLVALRYGDRFWHSVGNWLWWWPWWW